MIKVPDRIYIDKKDRMLYNKLDQVNLLRFKGERGRTRKEQFIFALAIGFDNNLSIPLETKEGWFNTRDLQPEDRMLFNAIALYKQKTEEVLLNEIDIFKIIEEYAHVGIKILCDKVKSTQFESFSKRLEKELFDLYDKIKIKR